MTTRRSPPLFVSAFSKGTGYAAEADQLAYTLRALALEHVIVPFESRGSWVKNCAIKPEILLAERAHDGNRDLWSRTTLRPVVWLDADARVRSYPELFDGLECDVAFHRKAGRDPRGELLSGTLYFGATENAGRLLELWRRECAANPGVTDQRVLDECVLDMRGLEIVKLPATYCQIFDLMKDAGTPVIEHMQASRRLRVAAGL